MAPPPRKARSHMSDYGEHNLAYQEYPPKTAILAHVCGVARQALMEKGREFESAFGARP